ncbi:MAG: hypothetical protein ABIQ70_05190 [Dokdonella sp.]
MSDSDKGTASMKPLAVIETITRLDELQRLFGDERRPAAFRIEQCEKSPQGYGWFNVLVDLSEADDAMRTVRSVLHALLDAADRGVVEHFRIVIGADLLRRADPSWQRDGETGNGPCVA